MINLFFLLIVFTLGDTIKSPEVNALQVYMIGDLGAYSKFNLKNLNRDIPINKAAHPFAPSAVTGQISIRRNQIFLSLGIFDLSTEASGLFNSSQLDTERIHFYNFSLIGEYKLWTNRQMTITPKAGCIYTSWSLYRILDEGKTEKKQGWGEAGLLGGIHLRVQKMSEYNRWFPFLETTYEYYTPFDGINRVLLRGGITLVNFVAGGNTEKQREANKCARMDIELFKGYTWGPFIEAQDHGIGFKFWFYPNIWHYEW